MLIQAQCKFCRVPVTLTADDECPPLQIEKWLPLICCNRCGGLQEWLRRKIDEVKKVCLQWSRLEHNARLVAKPGVEEKLEVLTRIIGTQVCRFHRIGFSWNKDFVDQLIERPDKAEKIVRVYVDIVRREALERSKRVLI